MPKYTSHPPTKCNLREALSERTQDIHIGGGAARRHELRPVLEATAFDVLLIDVVKLGGVVLLEELVAAYPRAVVLYTDLMDFTAQLLATGAAGYASKSDRVTTLVDVLRAVKTGGPARSPEAEECWRWYIVQGKSGRSLRPRTGLAPRARTAGGRGWVSGARLRTRKEHHHG